MDEHNVEYPEELQTLLEELMGNTNVYFQPPSNVKMNYPCIIYKLDNIKTRYANNNPYQKSKRYSVTYISKSPDQFIPDKIGELPTASFNGFFISDNLNHTVYNLYFDAKPNN